MLGMSLLCMSIKEYQQVGRGDAHQHLRGRTGSTEVQGQPGVQGETLSEKKKSNLLQAIKYEVFSELSEVPFLLLVTKHHTSSHLEHHHLLPHCCARLPRAVLHSGSQGACQAGLSSGDVHFQAWVSVGVKLSGKNGSSYFLSWEQASSH